MTDTTPAHIRIADDIRALTHTWTTHEPYTTLVPVPTTDETTNPAWQQHALSHAVTHASLLDQVTAAITGSTTTGEVVQSIPQSKPSARLDAVAVLQRIDRESVQVAHHLGTPARLQLRARLGRIAGASAAAADGDEHAGQQVARTVHGWVVAARVVTGWDKPAWAPKVRCPNVECERRSSIRIRLDQGIGLCTECGTFWDRDNIAVLGEYVRWADEHLTGARHWKYDAEGYPVECMECLETRQLMGERDVARVREARDAGRAPAAGGKVAS